LEAENQAFLTNCLQPWLQRLEQELELKCLLDAERVTHNIEFLVEGLLRSDTATRYQIYSVGRNWGLLTINECRRMESLPAVEGGDQLMQPMNMQTLSDTGVGARAPSGTQPTTRWTIPPAHSLPCRAVTPPGNLPRLKQTNCPPESLLSAWRTT
jgi:hypothetical protein